MYQHIYIILTNVGHYMFPYTTYLPTGQSWRKKRVDPGGGGLEGKMPRGEAGSKVVLRLFL